MPSEILAGETEALNSVTPDATSPEVVAPQDDTTALPSSGTDTSTTPEAAQAPTLESVIAQALDKGQTDTATTPDESGGDKVTDPTGEKQPEDADKSKIEAKPEGEGDDLSDDPTAEELATFKGRPAKRIAQLLSQRNEARRKLEALEPDAQNFRQIRTFMDQNKLADEDTANLFRFGAHLRAGRFEEAFEIVAPIMQTILEATGRSIPRDLRGRVETGEMTEEAARQLARERTARVQAETEAARVSAEVETDRKKQHVEAVRQATREWEARVRATDMDFDLKAEAMARFATALVAERGLPANPEEAVAFAQRAYDEASNFLRAARPAPKATRPAPPSGTSQSRVASGPAPSSLQEAVLAGLSAGARG